MKLFSNRKQIPHILSQFLVYVFVRLMFELLQ